MVKEISRRINVKSVMLSNETHARLEKLGRKSETYEDVVKRLLDYYEGRDTHGLEASLQSDKSSEYILLDSKTYKCVNCGMEMVTRQNPNLYECKCGSESWTEAS